MRVCACVCACVCTCMHACFLCVYSRAKTALISSAHCVCACACVCVCVCVCVRACVHKHTREGSLRAPLGNEKIDTLKIASEAIPCAFEAN